MTRRRSREGCVGMAIADAPRDELGRAPLTRRQRQVLLFVERHIGKHGWAPTRAEIADAMGFASKSGAQVVLKFLERKGWIKRGDGARAIRIVRE